MDTVKLNMVAVENVCISIHMISDLDEIGLSRVK